MSATLPTLIAITAAFMFSLAAHVQNIGLATEDTRVGTLVVVGVHGSTLLAGGAIHDHWAVVLDDERHGAIRRGRAGSGPR